MNNFSMNWIWATMIIPVIVTLFKAELAKLITIYTAYRRKAYPEGSRAQLFNTAKGEWGAIVKVVAYVFSLNSEKRGVYIRHADGGIEKVGILEWQSWRKRPALKKKGE